MSRSSKLVKDLLSAADREWWDLLLAEHLYQGSGPRMRPCPYRSPCGLKVCRGAGAQCELDRLRAEHEGAAR